VELDAADDALCRRAAQLLQHAPEVVALLLTTPDSLCNTAFTSNTALLSARSVVAGTSRQCACAAAARQVSPHCCRPRCMRWLSSTHAWTCKRPELFGALGLPMGLRRLEMRYCALSPHDAVALAPHIGALQHLTALELEGLPPPSVPLLTARLCTLPVLQHLALHDDGYEAYRIEGFTDDKPVHAACAHVPELALLTQLDIHMDERAIGYDSRRTAMAVLRAVAALPALAQLELCWSVRQQWGTSADFAKALQALRTLRPVLHVAVSMCGSTSYKRRPVCPDILAAFAGDEAAVERIQGASALFDWLASPVASDDQNSLSPPDALNKRWAAVAATFEDLRHLTSLSLHCGYETSCSAHAKAWQAALTRFTALQHLAFDEFGRMERPVLGALAHVLLHLTMLQHLELHTKSDGGRNLNVAAGAAALPLPPSLRSLHLCVEWPQEAVSMLGACLSSLPHLSSLRFVCEGAEGAAALAPYLPRLRPLRRLHLEHPHQAQEPAALAIIDKHIFQLTQLTAPVLAWDIAIGRSPEELCTHLGTTLGALTSLQSLDIQNLSVTGVCAIAPVLLELQHLTVVLFDDADVASVGSRTRRLRELADVFSWERSTSRLNEPEWVGMRLPPRIPVRHIEFYRLADSAAALQQLADVPHVQAISFRYMDNPQAPPMLPALVPAFSALTALTSLQLKRVRLSLADARALGMIMQRLAGKLKSLALHWTSVKIPARRCCFQT
jgi:hypothetical protein